MRFNKQELVTLATQPAHKFDKEGVLLLRERQDGFFRRTERKEKDSKRGKRAKSLRDLSCYGSGGSGNNNSGGRTAKVSLERWCRLRGNLLFYFKSRDQWSEPLGVLVLEQCVAHIDNPASTPPDGPFGFSLVWEGGLRQHLAARSDGERAAWLKAVEAASYRNMRATLVRLQKMLETRRDHHPDLDVAMWRLRCGVTLDPCELPLCEVSLACDNLLCDANGRPPNAVLLIHVYISTERVWVRYARTEVVERSSNPCFLSTISFRASDGLDGETRVRITAYDVREPVSHTALPLGCAMVSLRSLAGSNSGVSTGGEAGRLRVALRSLAGTTVGFVSMSSYCLERDDPSGGSSESTPCRQPQVRGPAMMHRRSHSLPPRLGCRLKLPPHAHINELFSNPHIQTYRFHSGLCGDIFVAEVMAESKLCFAFPCQLLSLWIQEEKELLQEVAGMGELREPWHSRQLQLLDRHLQLLHLYSQAQEHLQAHKGSFLKPSSRKQDRSLEFSPINLHLHRMWVQSDTLGRAGLYDVVTVGAFTAHSHRSKNGGLLKLLQQLKESPTKGCQRTSKMNMARDAIQAIKQLRREVVEGMRSLVRLAARKQTTGMLPICEDMITKTRTLLTLWDAGLVEEALAFVDEFKVAAPPGPPDEDDSSEEACPGEGSTNESGSLGLSMARPMQLSPFRRITQQLHFELKSPDVDVLATPDSPRCTRNFWEIPHSSVNSNHNNESQFVAFPDAEDDLEHSKKDCLDSNHNHENDEVNKKGYQNEKEASSPMKTVGDSAEDLLSRQTDEAFDQLENKFGRDDAEGSTDCLDVPGDGSADGTDSSASRRWFLDTRAMCSSPSANYYKPTEEPEPWDLTQLNIEASVMCLVSKVKFLCGRCGSPAVRLRSSGAVVRSQSFRGGLSQPQNMADGNRITSTSPGYRCSISSDQTGGEVINRPVVRNKFTEGLDLGSLSDWVAELRPSMRKLRAAMDGLLKTARLMHSAFRTQQDPRAAQKECNVRYRRDVCFSQALTALVTALMAKLWCQKPDPSFLLVLSTLGPIAAFEGLLSVHGNELDMWGDMVVAVEDLSTVTFTLIHSSSAGNSSNGRQNRNQNQPERNGPGSIPLPRVIGSRAGLTVLLPVPDVVLSQLPVTQRPSRGALSFRVTPVFFNIGINEMATLAESLGQTAPQHQSNLDNFSRVHSYFLQYRKLRQPVDSQPPSRQAILKQRALAQSVEKLRAAVHCKASKNVEVLQLAARITVSMQGLRFTSCKSAKDRTGMSVTLEQVNTLVHGYDLAETEFQRALDCLRSEGCRRENTYKNTGVRKYAFNRLSFFSLPKQYRPPAGTYGSTET